MLCETEVNRLDFNKYPKKGFISLWTGTSRGEATSSINKASNSSATATITIIMYAVADE